MNILRFAVPLLGSGGVLSSRAVSSQVLSALMGLTSVFGMGTGGTPSPLPPEIVSLFGAEVLCFALLTVYLPKVSFVLLYRNCRPPDGPSALSALRPLLSLPGFLSSPRLSYPSPLRSSRISRLPRAALSAGFRRLLTSACAS